MAPLDLSTFYPDTLVGVRDDPQRSAPVPIVDLFVGVVAVALLSLYMKCAAIAVIVAPHPIELLIWGELPGVVPGRPWDWVKQDRVPLLRVVACVLLQMLWCVRAIIIPVLAGEGSAVAYASSLDASAIVMNSIAISFVFDVDAFLYPLLVSRRNRDKFFSRQSRSERSALAYAMHDTWLVHRLTWLLWVVDVVSILDIYAHALFKPHYDGMYSTSVSHEMRNYLYVRGATAGLIQLVLAVKRQLSVARHRHASAPDAMAGRPRRRWLFALQVLAHVGVIYANCLFGYFVAHHVLSGLMGHRSRAVHYPYDLVDSSSQAAADAGWGPGEEGTFMEFCLSGENACEKLHLQYDWAAMREWVCGGLSYCLPDTGFFDA